MNIAFRNSCAVTMSLLMANLPARAEANAENKIANKSVVPTRVLVDAMDRAQAEKKVENYLNKDEVQKILIQRGLSPAEAKMRLAALSDSEMRQLVSQIEKAEYGGDILVTILLVVLIIFLVKRI